MPIMDRLREQPIVSSLKKLIGNASLDPEHSYEVQVSVSQELEAQIQGQERLVWAKLNGYMRSNSSRVRGRAMGVIGEMVLVNEGLRRLAMKELRDIVRLCCPVPGANLPKKDTSPLADICRKYLKRWEDRFDTEYPQLKYTIQVAAKKEELPISPNLESVQATVHKAKLIFDIHQTELTEQEKDMQHLIAETKECVRLYEDWNRPISTLIALPLELFSVETLQAVFGMESIGQEVERRQAKELMLSKVAENVKMLKQYSILLSNTYQHCEMALQVFSNPAEPYYGRVTYVRRKTVKLMAECQRLQAKCEELLASTSQVQSTFAK